MMPSARSNTPESPNSRSRATSDADQLHGITGNSCSEKLAALRREPNQKSHAQQQVRVFNVGRDRFFGSGTKYSSPNDTDSPTENQDDARHRTYKRKHRRCWNTSRTALQQDSGSESAPLLSSSASHASTGPIMFPNSETSDLDDSPVGSASRYGSVGAASFNSTATVLPRRLPPLAQENPLVISEPGDPTPGIHFSQQRCYEIQNIELLLSSNKYEGSETQQAMKDLGREYGRITLSSTLELGANLRLDTKPKQSSLVTIFSIWNTILGSSMLTIPWGLMMAGLIPGLSMILAMSGICFYTAYRLLKVHQYHGGDERIEVPELCRIFLGPFADHVARIFSITVLLGANVASWILMSNFLYNSANFFYDNFAGLAEHPMDNNITHLPEVLCPKEDMFNYTGATKPNDRSYDNLGPVWDLYKTVPIFLAVVIFPLLNFNTTTFFTKFNALGTAAIVYLVGFVAIKSARWGINMSSATWKNSWRLQSTFPALTGMLAMSFFIHNIIITIMQHNRDQKRNGRDLTIAYVLVTITYVIIGTTLYISFPLSKLCIEDNFLNNFQKWDGLTVGARMVLLFQLLTVYPLINYMLRIRLLSVVSPCANRPTINVIIVNLLVLAICVLFARFMPYIGTVIRYTGALSGLVYVFTLPSLLHLAILCKKGETTVASVVFHLCIPVIGVANLVGQLFVSSH